MTPDKLAEIEANIQTVKERFIVRENSHRELSNQYADGALKAMDAVINLARERLVQLRVTDADRAEALEYLNKAGVNACVYDGAAKVEKTIRAALSSPPAAVPDGWQDISTAPVGVVFVCRRKSKPHIQFEASISWEDDGHESSGEPYKVLFNETNENDIPDCPWDYYEWKAMLAAAPKPDGGE